MEEVGFAEGYYLYIARGYAGLRPMAESAARAAEQSADKAPQPRDSVLDQFEETFKVNRPTVEMLYDGGLRDIEAVRGATDDQLKALGVTDDNLARIRQNDPTSGGGDTILEKWLESRAKGTEKAKPRRRAAGGTQSTDLLKKWVAGDDNVMESWIKDTGGTPATATRAAVPAAAPSPATTAAPEGPTGPAPAAPSPPSAAPPTKAATPATAPATPAAAPSAPSPPSSAPPSLEGVPASKAAEIPADIREREETVIKWLTEMLEKARSDTFEPGLLLREAQELSRQVHEERGRRRELEEELEHVKKGSVAVIKYVRNREARAREEAVAAREAEILQLRRQLESARATTEAGDARQVLAERDGRIKELEEQLETARNQTGTSSGAQREIAARFQEELAEKSRIAAEKEAELKRKVIQLEEAVQNLKSERELAAKHEQLTKMDSKTLNRDLKEKMETVEARERAIVARENDLKAKIDELMVRAEEVEKKKAPLAYKETEFIKWEEELRIKEESLKAKLRQFEEDRKESTSPETMSKLKRLGDIEAEISKKESELKTREEYLHQKMEALEGREREVSDEEIKKSQEDLAQEVSANKVRSGVPRLDDLLFGGVPLGTNILVNGPAHTGKEIMARLLGAEGLKKGIPVIWVLSDKATSTVREEMVNILPTYAEYEKKGLVYYVDLYSMSLGVTNSDPNVALLSVDDKNLLENLSKAVDEAAAKVKQSGAQYYRLVFESVSTVTAYLDTTNTFRFLQPFTGKRKRERAVSYYLLETGMHGESDIQTLEHMMDGSINLKVDQLKTYMSVKGIGEVQSRAWIAYTFTKKVFNIGSFSLDHIR